MPDRRRNRGPHPKDLESFSPAQLPALCHAAADLAWLLDRGYSPAAALKLVGDRYALRQRQRAAVQRSTTSATTARRRTEQRIAPEALRDQPLLIDGYNVLLTVESALGGGVVLASSDGAWRDMASMSGHYKRVDQTRGALALIGAWLAAAGCGNAVWYLDRPISNSGRLKALMEQVATDGGWPWQVELVPSPDRVLAESDEIVATADGGILDRGVRWLSLAREVIDAAVPKAWVVDLFPEGREARRSAAKR